MKILKSVASALDVVDYLALQKKPVRITDLSSVFSMDKSKMSHILKTLLVSGYVEQVNSRQYVFVNKHIKNKCSLDEIVECKLHWNNLLVDLTKQTNECTHMGVLVGQQVWYIDKIESSLPLKVDHPIGTLSPLHCTALGKVLLAFNNIRYQGEFIKFTKHTISSSMDLNAELVTTRERGFAIDDEEFTIGIRCVAAPLQDINGNVYAAIGLSGPTVRISKNQMMQLGKFLVNNINKYKG